MKQEIVVNEKTGGAKGKSLARFDLLPWRELWEVAELYGVGASKYKDRNWEKGYAWSLSHAALHRHLAQFWNGESVDQETKCRHLTAVIFHALALMRFEKDFPDLDDRPKPPAPAKESNKLWPPQWSSPT